MSAMVIEVAAVAFALVFLLVGIFRTVEFSGIEISAATKRLLIALHVIGCLLFSTSLSIVALDLHEKHRTLAFCLFVASLLSLAPGQITIGRQRREESEKK